MCRLFYTLLLGAVILLSDFGGTHSFAIGRKVELDPNSSLKTTAHQTTVVQVRKVRQVDRGAISSGRTTINAFRDDQTTQLFFGEANSSPGNTNTDEEAGFPAEAFGTLMIPSQSGVENTAGDLMATGQTDQSLPEIQGGEQVQGSPVQASPAQVSPEQVSPAQVSPGQVSTVQVFPVQISPVQASPAQVSPEQVSVAQASPAQVFPEQVSAVQAFPVQVSPVQVSPAQKSSGHVFRVQQTINIGKLHSSVTGGIPGGTGHGRKPMTSDQITRAHQAQIPIGAATQSTMAQRPTHQGEPDKVPMKHKGNIAVVLNPTIKEGANTKGQTATRFHLPAGVGPSPVLKVEQVFNIRLQPSANRSPLPRPHGQYDGSSAKFMVGNQAPIQLEAGQLQQQSQMPMTSGIAGVEETNSDQIDSTGPQDVDATGQVQPEVNAQTDGSIQETGTPTDDVSPAEQMTNVGNTNTFMAVSGAEEATPPETDGGVMSSIQPETNVGSDTTLGGSQAEEGIMAVVDQAIPIQPETINLGSDTTLGGSQAEEGIQAAVDQIIPTQPETNLDGSGGVISDMGENAQVPQETGSMTGQIEEGTNTAGATNFQMAEANQPANSPNQMIDDRAMKPGFASIGSGVQQSTNSRARRPININRQSNGNVGEPSVSVRNIGLAPNPRGSENRRAAQRNRTVLIELDDDGFGSTEVIGRIGGNRTVNLPRLNEQSTPIKGNRSGGNRQEGKSRTVTIGQIQTAANERTTKQNDRTQPFSRTSGEQDDQSLEVNFKLLPAIKRIMKPELQNREKRLRMEFFRHSEEQSDISMERNDILTNVVFQQTIRKIDGRLKSVPETRGKRLIEKYAEALASISSSGSSPIMNSFFPFLIACLLICW